MVLPALPHGFECNSIISLFTVGGERAQAVSRITNKKGIRSNKTY
jgi:hypothetical protein